jgi:uncharacterized protein (DUF58 family)
VDFERAPQGAYCELADLLALRFAARQVNVTSRRRALSHLAGSNRASFRGRGIDFDEVRSYQPGDDIRAIDWRVTARTGNAHTKLFHEERERPVLVAVDQRPGMFFGSRDCFKSVLAAHLAALVAWSALEAGERVGGLVFGADGHRDLRPRRSRQSVLGLLSTVCDYNAALRDPATPAPGAAELLAKLRRIARPGSSVFLVSDLSGLLDEGGREHLFQLSRHTELTLLHCTDPLEETLPPPGRYTISDGDQRHTLALADSALRRHLGSVLAEARAEREALLLQLGIPCIEASTTRSPLGLLRELYGGARP